MTVEARKSDDVLRTCIKLTRTSSRGSGSFRQLKNCNAEDE